MVQTSAGKRKIFIPINTYFVIIIQDAFLAEFGIRNISQFTQNQRDQLLFFYLKNKYPSVQERQTIAESIGISEYQVKVWFSNRRSREKK